jgi:hypothetical protein
MRITRFTVMEAASVRALVLSSLLILAPAFHGAPHHTLSAQTPWRTQGEAFRVEVRAMNTRWDSGRFTSGDVVRESERLRGWYDRLGTSTGDLTGADLALSHALANQSFNWLAHVGVRYHRDAVVAQALMRTYGYLGDFYQSRFPYPGGAWYAYLDATRWARAVVLNSGRGSAFERDLERFALGWATVAYANGAAVFQPFNFRDLPETAALQPPTQRPEPKLVSLPTVEEAKLTPEQKALWPDLQARFRQVAAGVQQARILLDDVSRRLEQQSPRLTLNVQDAATALKMQGFLDDAADLVRDRQFEKAQEALERADYSRAKLKGTTGQ